MWQFDIHLENNGSSPGYFKAVFQLINFVNSSLKRGFFVGGFVFPFLFHAE